MHCSFRFGAADYGTPVLLICLKYFHKLEYVSCHQLGKEQNPVFQLQNPQALSYRTKLPLHANQAPTCFFFSIAMNVP